MTESKSTIFISKLQQNLHAGRSTVTDRVAPFSFQTSERCVDDPNCVRLEQPIS